MTLKCYSDWHCWIEILYRGGIVLYGPLPQLCQGMKWPDCGLLSCVFIYCSTCLTVLQPTHERASFFFSWLCKIAFTCIYQLPFVCCYHRDTPFLSARRLWLPGSLALTGERQWWASVSLARLWHQCSEKGIYLALTVFPWQPAPHRRWHVDPFLSPWVWRLRQSEIQLGAILSCNWNEFTWETAALRCLLAVSSSCSPGCM